MSKPADEGAGRGPIELAHMLRMYMAQQCFGLSDEGIEDAIYNSQSIRAFVGIDLGRESVPDATTLLRKRIDQHLPNIHPLRAGRPSFWRCGAERQGRLPQYRGVQGTQPCKGGGRAREIEWCRFATCHISKACQQYFGSSPPLIEPYAISYGRQR